MNDSNDADQSPWQVFLIFLRLGLTSFGGPIAHLGYFRHEFVTRRKWLSDQSYADLIALCQFMPGPASSQVGLAIGVIRAGYGGALAAWVGFTLPSAVILIGLALLVTQSPFTLGSSLVQGLKIVAVAVIAQAVWGMAKSYCVSVFRAGLTCLAFAGVLLIPGVAGQLGVIVVSAVMGAFMLRSETLRDHSSIPITISAKSGGFFLLLFFIGLFGLPLVASFGDTLNMINSFYRSGALVFGGGHVVLPLLQAETVAVGLLDNDTFLAGYAAAQAVPGPLFTFAGFLGSAMQAGPGDLSGGLPGGLPGGMPGGLTGGLIALLAIFTPAVLLVFGCLPFWGMLRSNQQMQGALSGVNAAVVGLLAAALVYPVGTSTIHSPIDGLFVAIALVALMKLKLPPWLVVIVSGIVGWGSDLVFL